MRGVRDPSATRVPPLFDGALEECEKTGLFHPGEERGFFYLAYGGSRDHKPLT